MGEEKLVNTAVQVWQSAKSQVRGWSWLKKSYAALFGLGFLISSYLFLTPMGEANRVFLAQTVITTQHRSWAWMLVGKEKRDRMVAQLHLDRELMASERQDFGMISLNGNKRTAEDLIRIEDISSNLWKGKKMYVFDPKAIRVVVPSKPGEGERISSMVERTGALAGINGGGFVDPDGLGNGFAPIGFIMSGGKVLITDQDGSIAQHVVGFTKDGVLVVGKYNILQLQEMGVNEAVMFYPRVIANGKGLITTGDGGWGRGPRTAIGQKADGTVVIMVIDGRQTHSVGATLKEIQDLMLAEGVVNAGFLDGGASSELVTQADGLITSPSSRYGERRLPSALLVFSDPNDYKANNPWEGVTSIDPGGAHDHPEFLKEQQELKTNGQGTTVKKPSTSPSGTPKATVSPSPTAKPAQSTQPSASTKPVTNGQGTVSSPAATPANESPATGATTPPKQEEPAQSVAPSPSSQADAGGGKPAGEQQPAASPAQENKPAGDTPKQGG